MRSTALFWTFVLLAGCGSKGDDGATGAAGAAGAPGVAGPAGPAGTTTTTTTGDGGTSTALVAAVNGVSPPAGLLGRELDVIVSGDGTSFDSTSTLDFGAGITVTKVNAISRAAIGAHLSIAVGATVGAHDVIIGGASAGTAHGAFTVNPSLFVIPISGAFTAGSTNVVTLTAPPGEAFGADVFQGGVAGGVTVLGPLNVGQASGVDSVSTTVYIDPTAPTGGGQIVIGERTFTADGGTEPQVLYASDPAAMPIVATPPTAVTLPTTTMATTLGFHASATYKMTTTGTGVLSLVDTSNHFATGTFTGPSGKALDLVATGTLQQGLEIIFTDAATRDSYASISNDFYTGNTAPLAFAPAFSFTPVAVTNETSASHPCTSAQPITLPTIIKGTIDSLEGVDCYSFTSTVGAHVAYTIERTGPVYPRSLGSIMLLGCLGSGVGTESQSGYYQETTNATACHLSLQASPATGGVEAYTSYLLSAHAVP